MSEELQKVVEAMGAEFDRQAQTSRDDEDFSAATGLRAEWRLDGRFDLEKVARAGLGAIHDPGNNAVVVGAAARAADESVTGMWAAMIREILREEAPKR